MKRILLSLVVLISLVGCTQTQNKSNLITPKDAYQKINNEDVIILDVRTKEEFDEGHIKNAINISHNLLNNEASTKLTNKDKTIIVYCRSGNRSSQASKILNDLGYKNIYDLGGINNWPYEIVK